MGLAPQQYSARETRECEGPRAPLLQKIAHCCLVVYRYADVPSHKLGLKDSQCLPDC